MKKKTEKAENRKQNTGGRVEEGKGKNRKRYLRKGWKRKGQRKGRKKN